jgi:hypothetical protein
VSRPFRLHHRQGRGFRVEQARTEVYALKTRLGKGENIAESFLRQKTQAAKMGVTVDQVIAERVTWMKTPVLKRDGEMRPASSRGATSKATCGASSALALAR